MHRVPSWPCTSSLPCSAPQGPQLSRDQRLWREGAGGSLFLWNELSPSSPRHLCNLHVPRQPAPPETVSSSSSQGFQGPVPCPMAWGTLTAPSSVLWIPWESPVPPVISMVTRAAEVATVCGMATVSLRLGADAEVSSRSVAQALQGELWDCPRCLELCKQPETAWPAQLAYQPC